MRSWPLPAIASRAVKNVTRIILAIAVAHSKCPLRGTVSRVSVTGFREVVAKTEAAFSRWLTASYWNCAKQSELVLAVVLTQESGSKQRCGHPAFTNHPSQITKHSHYKSLPGGYISLSLASFLPSPSNICWIHFFCCAQRPTVLCISHCHPAETPCVPGCEHQPAGHNTSAFVPAVQGGTGQ